MPEPIENAAFANIAEIGKERIRRTIKAHLSEIKRSPKLTDGQNGGLGFRVYSLQRSNFVAWQDYLGDDPHQLELLFERATSQLTDGWEPEDVLTESLLLEGFPLDSTVTDLAEYKKNTLRMVKSDVCAYRIFICLDKKIKDETLERLQMEPEDVFVCLDSALTDEGKVRLGDLGNLRVI